MRLSCLSMPILLAALLTPCGLLHAQADSAAELPTRLQASWCTAPHDDYRRGAPMIEIRQLRDVQVVERGDNGARAIGAQMRSALVSTRSGRVEFVGAWVDYRFDVLEPMQLLDASIGLALTLQNGALRVAYKYGGSGSYLHQRCGGASVELTVGEPVPAQLGLARAGESAAPQPADAIAPAPAPVPETASHDDARSARLNRSYCLAMERTPAGFFGLANRCTSATNYTYCIVRPTTANGRLALCAQGEGAQLGVEGGFLRAGERAYLSMPLDDRGKVVWFACEYPATPVLTGTQPPRGYCK